MTITRFAAAACLLLWPGALFATRAAVDFNRDIRPVLSDNCYHCHGPDVKARKADLRLDTREGAFRIKNGKTVILPGKASQSDLYRRLVATDPDDLMPPPKSHRKLTPEQIDLVRRWIDEGANWSQHWAFISSVRPALPKIKNTAWPRNAIDHFVLAELEKQGLSPAPAAAKETLLRRVTLDLTGLPPTPAEVDAFLADAAPDAYEKVVDRLLRSPRYGERMVWEWLDAARYADSNGYQGDQERTMWPWRDWAVRALNENLPFDQFTLWQLAGDLLPNATLEQKLATGFNRNHMINGEGGRIAEENRIDYLFDQTETVGTVWLGATLNCTRCHDHKFDPFTMRDYFGLLAFFNNTPVNGGGGSGQTAPVIEVGTPEQNAKLATARQEVADLAGKISEREKELFPRPAAKTAADSTNATSLAANILKDLKRVPGERTLDGLRDLAAAFKKKDAAYSELATNLRSAIERRDAANKSFPRVMVMEEMAKPRDTFLLIRGDYTKLGDKAALAVPASLGPLPKTAPPNRLGLAQWLVSPEHPLTARVTVNRYWSLFFGTGLVKTAEDFGVQGEKPSHPELLDWLATEFIGSGVLGLGSGAKPPTPDASPQTPDPRPETLPAPSAWNVKRLHKLIVMSATYQQSSKLTPAQYERDPENRLLARGPRHRLPSWMLRDVALAASGLLVERVGGPPVKPYQPAGIWEEATFGNKKYVQDHGDALYRRSLYIFWRRIIGPTLFFDVSSRQNCTVKTPRTNTPLHALATLNDLTYVEAARALGERILLAAPQSDARLEHAFRLVLARPPAAAEKQILLARLATLKQQYTADSAAALKLLALGESKRNEKLDPVEHAAWTGLCSLVLNLDEAISKE
ncbi:chromosome segregation protein [Verrucomicrobiota bacterium]|nr:chromosome segregation protein [Verrucomicrobiota bacterium]